MKAFQRIMRASILLLLVLGAPLRAEWQSLIPGAQVQGSGEFRMWGFAIYQARFWSSGAADQPLNMTTPFALELTYRRSISRDDLVDASIREIHRLGLASPDPQIMAQWQQAMHSAFADVSAGDRITGVFLPGQGSRFYFNDEFQHAVPDEAFAHAFFAIWLDQRTRNPRLRAQLLSAD